MATKKQTTKNRRDTDTDGVISKNPTAGRSTAEERSKFYRIEIRPQTDFSAFRTHEVEPGHLERVAGKRPSGNWATAAWLVSKDDAHIEDGELVIDNKQVRMGLRQLRGSITKVRGHVFSAQTTSLDRQELTPAQRTARQENIRKAQAARWKRR